MSGLYLAQNPTPIPPEQVVEVIQQVSQLVDTFDNLGVFMAVLLVIALFAFVILFVVWAGRKSGTAAVDVLSKSNAEKIAEIQEMRKQRGEEMTLERNRQQQNHDQFMLMFAGLMTKQAEGEAAFKRSGREMVASIAASEKALGSKVEGARDTIVDTFEDTARFMIMMLEMALEDPPATRSRLKRAREAWGAGNMQGAQDIADEDVPMVAAVTPETASLTEVTLQ